MLIYTCATSCALSFAYSEDTSMMFRVMFPYAFPLMLAACADCTQDPSQAGFFCGIRNIAEGTYENRQTAMRRETEQVEADAQQRGDELRSLQSQEASLAADKEDLLAKLASIQADLDKQKRLLAEARLQRRADRDKLAELEMHLRTLQDKRAQLARSRTISAY